MRKCLWILFFTLCLHAQNLDDIKKGLKGNRKDQTAAFEALLKINTHEANLIHASHFGGDNPYHRDKSYEYLLTVDESEGKWLASLPLTEKNPYARKLFLDLLADRATSGKKDEGVSETILKFLSNEKDPSPLGAALIAAGKMKIAESAEIIRKKLSFKHARVKAYAYEALARLEGKKALETLREILTEKEVETLVYSLQTLAELARNFGPRGYAKEQESGTDISDPSKLKCPKCGSEMNEVTPRSGKKFYGCTKFRSDNCKGRIEIPDASAEEKESEEVDSELRNFALEVAYKVFKDAEKNNSEGWRLRSAVFQVLSTYPDSRSIELLIQYLKTKPEGKMPAETARTLYAITNKDLGDDAKIWEGWWNANREKWKPTTWGYPVQEASVPGKSTASYYGLQIFSDRIAFILDGSGSMNDPVTVTRKSSGGSVVGPATQTLSFLERARQELFRTLNELAKNNPKTKIQVIFFQEKLLIFSPSRLAPLKGSIPAVDKFLNKITAEQSGDMLAAIQTAMADPEVDTIFLLSDGAPSAGLHTLKDAFLKWIAEENRFRCIQFFGIIIGSSSRGKSIMMDLSKMHQGKAIEDDLVLRE